jgi:hypothetical protein
VAFVFVLALLLDSACAAACIPAELEAPSEDCASGHHGNESHEGGCDFHSHMKPVVKDRGLMAAATTTEDAPASFESPAAAIDLRTFSAADAGGLVLHVPPLFRRSAVLRI